MAALTKRDQATLRGLIRKAGGHAELIELIRRMRELPEPKRGRSRNDFFNRFSIGPGPAGLVAVRFHLGGAARSIVAVIDPKARGRKPIKDAREREKKSAKELLLTMRPTLREIVQTVWDAYVAANQDQTLSPTEREALSPHIGWHVKAATLRLERELRKAGNAKRKV
jgi:hypothetical protein